MSSMLKQSSITHKNFIIVYNAFLCATTPHTGHLNMLHLNLLTFLGYLSGLLVYLPQSTYLKAMALIHIRAER